MTREIHKKLSKKYFDLIASGQKTFEFRVADFECEPGDVLVLEEYEYEDNDDTVARRPTGGVMRKKVGHVFKTEDAKWLNRPDVKADAEKYGFQIISLLDEEGSRKNPDGVVDTFEVSCKVLLLNPNKTKAVLLLHSDGTVGVPGGHMSYGETLEQTVRRELGEELGIEYDGKLDQAGFFTYTGKNGAQRVVLLFVGELDEDTEFGQTQSGNPDLIAERKWVHIDDIETGKYEIYEQKDILLKLAGRIS